MTDQSASQGSELLDGYTPEDQMAKARGVTVRTLRAERQRGDGPPWVKMGKQVLYPNDGFRNWLKAMSAAPFEPGAWRRLVEGKKSPGSLLRGPGAEGGNQKNAHAL